MRSISSLRLACGLLAGGVLVSIGVSANPTADTSSNDYPTQARVEYVLRCMDYHGGQVYENMYACVCSIDRIASELTYNEFLRGEVLAQLRSTPGERGGLFREGGRELVTKYLEVTEAAEESCFSSGEAQEGRDSN